MERVSEHELSFDDRRSRFQVRTTNHLSNNATKSQEAVLGVPLPQCPPTLPGLVNGCGACTAEVLGVCPESDESAISRSSSRDGPWWVNPWATVDRVKSSSRTWLAAWLGFIDTRGNTCSALAASSSGCHASNAHHRIHH